MYLKFTRKNTLLTLHEGYRLPSPYTFAPPIKFLSPPIRGYHLYTEKVLSAIKDYRYNRLADLWVAEIDERLPFHSYIMMHDKPAGVLPIEPMGCVCASSIRLIKKVPFKITAHGIVLTT